uniref:NADH-ubiquinone oxidoreductase chain 4L n=1 Tax=Leptaulax koreanus TaxID=2607329 RepID=A0A5C0XLH8_9SCAR|nr:NADH dehydrogenase subunit 4L [Leptaulax koreanus]QEK77361.1 NADH dehydrogenase subunit 4L [Leptaulax koreanus]
MYISIMLFYTIFVFLMQQNHLLMMLMLLEMMILLLFFMLVIYLGYYMYEFYFSMLFLTMCVCESVLGLSILVSLIRVYGNDFYQSFNILW